MLTLGQALLNKKVLSLRNSAPIGLIVGMLIDPNNLKIEGWFAKDSFNKDTRVLLSKEIRDIIPQGFVVDDDNALSIPHDLVRLQPILQLNFTLIDKPVLTEDKHRLGKVTDFAFDRDSYFIQKIYASQSVLKSFSGATLPIDRTQIVEVTNRKIVVKDATVPDRSPVPVAQLAN